MGITKKLEEMLDDAGDLLSYKARGVPTERLHWMGSDFVDRVLVPTDRPVSVLQRFQAILNHGRLAGTGYVSVLPVDQGVEHSAGNSFTVNPIYFDPENIVRLALEGGCNAVASSVGVLGAVSRKYAHKIPFICKINHNELLSYPNDYSQILFADVEQAADLGAQAVGATIYFGHPDSKRQITEISQAFATAHELGLVTVLWCYVRNEAFRTPQGNFEVAADLTGQANYLGSTIQADILKQKMPTTNGGFRTLKFGKYNDRMYDELMPGDHPIEMVRYQVANGFMGRAPLLNSGGATGRDDFVEAARTAVINKRAGGFGLITGRKAFQRSLKDGIDLLNLVQDVYLDKEITLA